MREALPIPVLGLTEAALASAALLGGRFSIIAISQRIQAWYRERVLAHGFHARLASIRGLDEPLADIGRVQTDQSERLIALAQHAITEDGADTLIMAGAPLAGLARSVADQIPVAVIDGVTCAMHQAQALVAMGVGRATAGSYAAPPSKPQRGLSPAVGALIGRQA